MAAGLVAMQGAGCTRAGFDDWRHSDQSVGSRDVGSTDYSGDVLLDARGADARADLNLDSSPASDASADAQSGDTMTDAEPRRLVWTTMISTTVAPLYGVWGSSPEDVFAVGSGGVILHYDGDTWRVQDSRVTVQSGQRNARNARIALRGRSRRSRRSRRK